MHQSVLLSEIVEYLRPARDDGTLVDATIGLGGHAEALLERYPQVHILGIDRDPQALAASAARLERFGNRVTFAQGRHETLIDILKKQNIESVSGLLADLGVSSMQLDDASRGFSFRYDAPLDMRMGPQSKSSNRRRASQSSRSIRSKTASSNERSEGWKGSAPVPRICRCARAERRKSWRF